MHLDYKLSPLVAILYYGAEDEKFRTILSSLFRLLNLKDTMPPPLLSRHYTLIVE